MQTDGYVTAAKLKVAYLGIGVKQKTLLKLFEQYLADTFGKENVVSAILHMDEQTPHIHAILVPIVRGRSHTLRCREVRSR